MGSAGTLRPQTKVVLPLLVVIDSKFYLHNIISEGNQEKRITAVKFYSAQIDEFRSLCDL